MGKLLSGRVWVILIFLNVFFFGFSIIIDNMSMAAINIMSAFGCYVGYYISSMEQK